MTPTWIIHFIPCGQPSYHTHGLNRYGSLELELNLPLEPRQAMLFINLIANEVAEKANGTAPGIGRMMCSISRVTFLKRLPSGPVGTTTECSAFSFVIPLGNIRGSRSVRRHTQTN